MKRAKKTRITVTIDPAFVDAANAAIAAGRAASLSAWVSEAVAKFAAEQRRVEAGWEAIRAYEAEHGVITEAEMRAQERADRRNAIRVRGKQSRKRRKAA